jgi:hypothetical protein
MKTLDITGMKKNNLTAASFSHSKNGRRYWRCVCDCGKYTFVTTAKFTSGATKSCGCARNTHGDTSRKVGKSYLYGIWEGIKQRCNNHNNKSYKIYGGRGIDVCESWNRSYENFRDWAIANGGEHGLDIDRIDNNKGYGPDNCRFVTRSVNNLNRRATSRNKSGFMGVNFNKENNCWEYSAKYNGKRLRKSGFRTAHGANKERIEEMIKNGFPARFYNEANHD